jgi:hypothetical protein
MRSMMPATDKTHSTRRAGLTAGLLFTLTLGVGTASYLAATDAAHALSEIQREELPPPATTPPAGQGTPPAPLPAPVQPADPAAPTTETPGDQAPSDEPTPAPDDEQVPDEPENAGPDPDAPLPEIQYDLAKLPEPVQRMRNQIIEAAKTGELERLRPLLGSGTDQTQLSLGGIDGDPITYLKELAGDEGGQEILAIIEEVLSAGYVHMEPGTANDFYVWPYFFAIPLDKLTPPQRVELFKIITAGDYEDMKTYGAYIFYRIGITPDGRWSFFIAGD